MAIFERRLSLASLEEWAKELEIKKKKYPKIALRIADRMADEMLKNVTYKSTEKIPAKLEGKMAVSGIRNTEPEKYIWKEMRNRSCWLTKSTCCRGSTTSRLEI